MTIIKPLKVTAEFVITPEDFKEWCGGDVKPSEKMFKVYVEKMLWNKLGMDSDSGNFDEFIPKPVEFNGIKVSVEHA